MNLIGILAAMVGAPAALSGGTLRRAFRGRAFSSRPDPVFLFDREGRQVEANPAGWRFLSSLPAEGRSGDLGEKDFVQLLRRAAGRDLVPWPLRVETAAGSRHYQARFSPARGGLRTLVLEDVTAWKQALREQAAAEALSRAEAARHVPVCAGCGSVRDRGGTWSQAGGADSRGIAEESRSHGLCPDCLRRESNRQGLDFPEFPSPSPCCTLDQSCASSFSSAPSGSRGASSCSSSGGAPPPARGEAGTSVASCPASAAAE